MNKSKNLLNNIVFYTVVSVLIINIALLFWYIFYEYRFEYHSDSAVKVLLAREIVDTKNYFPTDWNYINNDLFVFFGHTFIIPLLALLPAGFTVHAISGLIVATLLLSGVWFVSGITTLSTIRRLLIVATVATGISAFMSENLYGQVSYGVDVMICCYLLFFSWSFLKTHGKYGYIWGAALFFLVLIAYWENPQRATLDYSIPLLAALAWLFWQGTSVSRKKFWQISGVFFISASIGVGLHVYTMTGINNTLTSADLVWLPYESVLRNLNLAFLGVLSIFGGLPLEGKSLRSLRSIYEAIQLMAAVTTTVLMPWVIYKFFRYVDEARRFLAIFCAIAFLSVFFIFITTNLADMSDPIQSSRYLVSSLFLGLIIFLMSPLDRFKFPLSTIAIAFIFVFFTMSSYYVSLSPRSHNDSIRWGQKGQYFFQISELTDFLVNNQLEYGYASYWNAGLLSVLSDEKSLVRQIVINDGVPIPMRHLSSNRWYQPDAWLGETFLLLTHDEADLINWNKMEEYGVRINRTYEIGRVKVYVFKDNLANHLPDWNTSYRRPVQYEIDEKSLSRTGHFDETERALVAEKGDSGDYLYFGPYVRVESGDYVATFDVWAAHNPNGVLRLDVANSPQQKIYAEASLSSSEQSQQLYFTLKKAQIMEFRVWVSGNERVVFKGVTIERLQR